MSLAALLLAGIGPFVPARGGVPDALKAGVFEPPRLAPEFSLRGSDGGELTLGRYRGKVVALSFGYTSCAAVCPVTLATLAEARRRLGKSAEDVQVIFVTVDPEHDDAAQMRRYLKAFDPSFVGATGSPDALAAMRKAYGVTARKEVTASGYVMDHTSSIYLIDRAGRLRALMPYGRSADDFAHDLGLLAAR